jgi:DNA (cytosine-5)-methyltransferase 1
MGAANVGANHQRDRIWIKATAQSADTDLQSSFAKPEVKYNWPQESDASSKRGMGTSDATKTNMAYTRRKLWETRDTTELDANSKIRSASSIHNQSSSTGQIPHANSAQRERMQRTQRTKPQHSYAGNSCWWQVEPDVGRMADGVAAGVDRLKAIGNGQVPLCAATAWRLLSE